MMIADQNPNEGANKAVKPVALIVCCLLTCICRHSSVRISIDLLSLFMLTQNSLARTDFNTPKTCHMKLASLHWLKTRSSAIAERPRVPRVVEYFG